jgi:methionyl-tRNA synthetase
MSKSRGNIVRPEPIRRVMGADGLRYFLLREIVFGQDGSFSYDALVGRYNSDLANGLGNLASRTLTMIKQYSAGAIPAGDGDSRISAQAAETIAAFLSAFENFEFSKGLEALWALLSATDKYIVEQAPWKLARAAEGSAERAKLTATLYTAAEVVRIATVLLAPVLPESTPRIWSQLGMKMPLESVCLGDLRWGQIPQGQQIGEIEAVFPRIDAKQAIPRMRYLETEEAARQAALVGKAPAAAPAQAAGSGKISIDDFSKVDLRVGQVLAAESVKGANKLLKLTVDIAEPEPRTLMAGIAEAYTPEQLIGRKVVIVANLEPRKLRGVMSNGMIVAASVEGGKAVLAGFLEDIPVGARLK